MPGQKTVLELSPAAVRTYESLLLNEKRRLSERIGKCEVAEEGADLNDELVFVRSLQHHLQQAKELASVANAATKPDLDELIPDYAISERDREIMRLIDNISPEEFTEILRRIAPGNPYAEGLLAAIDAKNK